MVDYAFLTFIGLIAAVLAVLLFRKRLITALTGFFLTNAVGTLDALLFEEAFVEVKGKKVKQKTLTPYFRGLLAQAAPIMVQEGMKAIKLKAPQNLPINAEGQLDFMAPVLQKLASGKKVKIEDFLPVIIDKAMPYVEGFLGKMGQPGGASPASETAATKNPFLPEEK